MGSQRCQANSPLETFQIVETACFPASYRHLEPGSPKFQPREALETPEIPDKIDHLQKNRRCYSFARFTIDSP